MKNRIKYVTVYYNKQMGNEGGGEEEDEKRIYIFLYRREGISIFLQLKHLTFSQEMVEWKSVFCL